MSHKDIIYDSDPHFKINAITRKISNESSTKTALIQNDHNSERFSFEMDRFIEGHDMMECNRVEVHYNNNGNEDVYEVDDVQISPNNDDTVVFSWLLSNNATQSEGKLEFSVRFACTSEDGIVDYAWNTAIFNGITISKGMNNTEAVAKVISDIIAKWKEELKPGGGGGVTSYTDLTDKPITVFEYYPSQPQIDEITYGCYIYTAKEYYEPSIMVLAGMYNEEINETPDGDHAKTYTYRQCIIDQYGIKIREKAVCEYYPDWSYDWREVPLNNSTATKEYVNTAIGNIETSLENIIAKYGLGGDSV